MINSTENMIVPRKQSNHRVRSTQEWTEYTIDKRNTQMHRNLLEIPTRVRGGGQERHDFTNKSSTKSPTQ